MKLHLDKSNPANRVRSCTRSKTGFVIRIDEQDYTSSLIITPDEIIDWKVNTLSEIRSRDFKKIADLNPEVVILGTGPVQEFPDPKVHLPLIEAGIGLEVMNTPAACRTYSILLSDDRIIIAALIL
ncbi:MAG: Mth938-like domain-containing protein [Gammaproteobacteria bacterium]|nr:Mth938-like domain-containing protein [Gammaproteobacteria bacterium]MCY4227429.1 Mth938-like domain-containing protein [Gammaproteobacteria bacterium]MCY4313990.1 Mth938-like domain-containing protein [Gammaproteobacteria bacterium]